MQLARDLLSHDEFVPINFSIVSSKIGGLPECHHSFSLSLSLLSFSLSFLTMDQSILQQDLGGLPLDPQTSVSCWP